MATSRPAVVPPAPADHSLLAVVCLHLAPGLLTIGAYLGLAPVLMARGYPALFALLLATIGVLVPLELGYLMYRGKQVTGAFQPLAVVGLREPLPGVQYLVWPALLFGWGILCSILTAPIERWTEGLFTWLPSWFFAADLVKQLPSYSPGVLQATFWLGLVVGGFIGPVVEELYFRGFLLPRLGRLGRWAPFVSAVLFSAYHFWTPWQNASRIALMVPLTYLVWRKRNIYLGMIAHIALNTIVWGITLGSLLRAR